MGILFINIGLVVLFGLVILYFYIKDNETQKRLHRYERVLDDINKEIYKVQKFLKDNGVESNFNDNSQDFRDELKAAINDIYIAMERDREYMESKFLAMEDKVKDTNFFPSGTGGIDDRRIITMFKDGWSIEAIARELRITKSEVEFTLKLADIN